MAEKSKQPVRRLKSLRKNLKLKEQQSHKRTKEEQEAYSTDSVSGMNCVGGLAGCNFGHINYCYSTGTVSCYG